VVSHFDFGCGSIWIWREDLDARVLAAPEPAYAKTAEGILPAHAMVRGKAARLDLLTKLQPPASIKRRTGFYRDNVGSLERQGNPAVVAGKRKIEPLWVGIPVTVLARTPKVLIEQDSQIYRINLSPGVL
jgi:hypothetical protein